MRLSLLLHPMLKAVLVCPARGESWPKQTIPMALALKPMPMLNGCRYGMDGMHDSPAFAPVFLAFRG
jgi:hypothetical protein